MRMKIAVMGAGAVGCYYGGMLARAGHEVTLIGRPQHVAAVQREGLILDTLSFRETVPLAATSEASGVSGAELVLFCVKSTETENAAAQIAPHLLPDALVLSLQNGVDNADRVRACLPQHEVAATVVYVASEMAGPGHVKHHGRGELVLAESPRSAATAQLLSAAGIATEVEANVVGALWAKLILNCAYNALSAIARRPYGQLVQAEGVVDLIRDVVHECLAIAQAEGVTVPGNPWDAVERIARTMPTQSSSTAQDHARGKLSEIDHLNGYVVRRGSTLGIATPANRALWVVIKLLENR